MTVFPGLGPVCFEAFSTRTFKREGITSPGALDSGMTSKTVPNPRYPLYEFIAKTTVSPTRMVWPFRSSMGKSNTSGVLGGMSKLTREVAQADLERAYQAYQETLVARRQATRDRSLFGECGSGAWGVTGGGLGGPSGSGSEMTQRLTVELSPEDFVPMAREAGCTYLGPIYPFMGAVDAVLDVAQVVVSGMMAEFRFETADGEPWGGLDSGVWWNVEASELLKRKGFLVGRLWTKQQVMVAEECLKRADAGLGFTFRYGQEVRAAYGVPAQVTFRF